MTAGLAAGGPGGGLTPDSVTAVGVFDPETGGVDLGELRIDASGSASVVRTRPLRADDRPGLYVGPGWVDLHAHVFDGSTQISVHPDRVGLDHGVHTVADAGSAGEATLRGLIDYVIPRAETAIKVWLNIGSHGLVHLREVADASFIDVPRTIAAIEAAPAGLVRGIKVRSSGAIVGNMGLQPLQLARLAARECGLPLLVHIGEAPPMIDDVLDVLDSGDTVTHCYHGKAGFPWLPDGRPAPALRRALDRGVRLDVGHGAASFSVAVAEAAVRAGFGPHSISTDIHVRNIGGPVFDIATVMTKLLHCGMPLPAVVAAVTAAPRETLGLDEPWLGEEIPSGVVAGGEAVNGGALDGGAVNGRAPAGGQRIRHATIFAVGDQAPEGRRYLDSGGAAFSPAEHISAVATVVAGTLRRPSA